jgi:hypothetical protein
MRNSGAEDVERQENRMVDNDNGVNNEWKTELSTVRHGGAAAGRMREGQAILKELGGR